MKFYEFRKEREKNHMPLACGRWLLQHESPDAHREGNYMSQFTSLEDRRPHQSSPRQECPSLTTSVHPVLA
jgi:hypothetical protein